jgi:Alpha/beta hydrolase domain
MNSRTLVGVMAIGILSSAAVGEARVTRIEILKVEPAPAPAGASGQYEKITGKAYGELDPADPKNALITDIQFAPRNGGGKAEYIATFALIKPVDMAKASGVLMYSVVNRGNGVPTASPDGHVSLVSGWQGDVLPTAINQTIQVPRARNPDGSSITGPFLVRLTDQTGSTAALIIPRNTPSPYPPASLDTAKASLVSAASESATGVKDGVVKFSSSDWAFADCTTAPFPGKPDPTHLCLKNGFNPALLYELQYVVKDPLVLGMGLAATRDVNSFFRYEKQDDAGTPNPVAGRIRWAVSEGSSQSGTFLRAYIHLGFNQDEKGRIVWDGSNPHIASRVIDLNRRFALPGGTVQLYELGTEAPAWWEDWADTARGRGTGGLLDRCRATRTCPKIMETFGSAELWGLRASFMLVGTTAKADLPLPDNVRRYYFPGVTHGGGPGGFSTTSGPAAGCELPANPAPAAPMRAALLARLTDWVARDAPMPPSRYPTLADGTLVADTIAAMGFPRIPGKPSPEHLVHPLLDYELGTHFSYQDQSGFLTKTPSIKQVLPLLVVKVDADGNEVAGVKSPLQMAPLGTYTGWNVLSSGVFKGQMCQFTSPIGGFIPFVKTKAERLASGDPRPSLEERYHTHDGYTQAVTAAAGKLVHDGFLRQADADAMIRQAEASDILR